MNKFAWRTGLAILTPAAAGMCAWSIYTVAHDQYDVPAGLAVGAGLVFDGTALCTLALATEAIKKGRGAAGPISATVFLAGLSVYLNHTHALLYGWGLPATVLFAMPTVALLLVMLFSQAPDRAEAREKRGESPLRMPAYGFWGWLLAPWQAVVGAQTRASDHVKATAAAKTAAPAAEVEAPRRTAHQLLVEKFSRLDPFEVITLLADAHPGLDAQELADMTCHYGTTVDATHVALVLGGERITVRRAPAPAPTPASAAAAPVPPQLPPASPTPYPAAAPAPQSASAGQTLAKADLVRQTAALLGPGVTARIIAEAVTAQHGILTADSYVRTVQSRDRKAAAKPVDQAPQVPAAVQDPLPEQQGRHGYL